MKNPDLKNKFISSLTQLKSALEQLQEFNRLPIKNNRDRAGVIQAFEFTYELFWKTFQKLAFAETIEANSPRLAIQAAFQIKIIADEEEQLWIDMMKDRNLTSHTYHEEVAEEILKKIQQHYLPLFKSTFERLKSYYS